MLPVVGRACAANVAGVPGCVVATYAGDPFLSGNADGSGTSARFSQSLNYLRYTLQVPNNRYFMAADTTNNRVRLISAVGNVVTGRPTISSVAMSTAKVIDVLFVDLQLSGPLATGPFGSARFTFYLLDCVLTASSTTGSIGASGAVVTVAGSSGQCGYLDGSAPSSRLLGPVSVTGPSVFPESQCGASATVAGKPVQTGCMYILDKTMVRRLTGGGFSSSTATKWTTSFVAGSTAGVEGYVDGAASNARFKSASSIALSTDGATVFVADGGSRSIRTVDALTGAVSTLVGTCSSSCGFPWADGVGTNAVFSGELGQVQISPDNSHLYVADMTANRLRAVEIGSRRVFTVAGNSTWAPTVWTTVAGVSTERAASGFRNGAGDAAVFNRIKGVTVAPEGDTIFTSESGAGLVRVIYVPSSTSSVSPSPTVSPSVSGAPIANAALVINNLVGPGISTASSSRQVAAQFCNATDFSFVAANVLNHCIIIVTTSGVKILAGFCGKSGSTNGAGDVAMFSSPQGVAFTGPGNTGDIIVADLSNNVLRKISMAGFNPNAVSADPKKGSPSVTVSLLSGTVATVISTAFSYKIGSASESLFSGPTRITRHSSGNCKCCGGGCVGRGNATPSRGHLLADPPKPLFPPFLYQSLLLIRITLICALSRQTALPLFLPARPWLLAAPTAPSTSGAWAEPSPR